VTGSEPTARDASRSILELLSLDEAIEYVAGALHEHASAQKWGTQTAVARYLETLALDLDDCVNALREEPRG
jgi:hypothetical protein